MGVSSAVDPVQAPDAPAAARLIVSWDRGEHVRSGAAYDRLAQRHFDEVHSRERRDLLRIPYAHWVLECRTKRAQRLSLRAWRFAPSLVVLLAPILGVCSSSARR